MADLDFSVNADTSSAQRNLKSLESSVSGAVGAFKLLAGAVGITSLAQFSDSVTNLKNKLMLLSDTQAQANTQFNALVGIASSARTDLAATGDLYFRIARAAKDLGISQAEAGQITESLAKAMSASGLSANEAAGPLLQLGQALQSGVFQGDELRSILEGMPPVAKALADQLGVPIGALRKMGAEGQITSQDFVAAMRRAKDSIEQDFAKTIPTIGQAFTVLKNQTSLAFSNFETSTQTGQSFALAIEYIAFQIYKLSKNIDDIVGPLFTFIKILGTIAAFTIAGRVLATLGTVVTTLIRAFSGAGGTLGLFIERFKMIPTQLASGVQGLGGFGAMLIWLLNPLGRFVKAIGAVIAGIGTFVGLDKVGEWFKDLGKDGSDTRNELEEFRKQMAGLKTQMDTTAGAPAPDFLDPKKMKEAKDKLDQIVISYARQNEELTKRLRFEGSLVGIGEQQKAVSQALFDLESGYLQEVSKLTDEYREKSASKAKEDQAQLPMIQKAIQDVTEKYQSQIGVVRDLVTENQKLNELERQRQSLVDFTYKSQIDNAKSLMSLQDEMAKSGLNEIQKKYYDIAAASRDSAKSAIDTENSRRRGLKEAQMTTEEELKYFEIANRGNSQLMQAQKKLYDQSRTFEKGWGDAFRSYVDDATNAAKTAERLFQKAFQGIEDLLVDFVKTGKFEWKSFVASMAEELLRSQIKQLLGGIGSALGMGSMGLGGQAPGASPTNPMYVFDVSGGGIGGGGGMGGGYGDLTSILSGGGFGGGMAGGGFGGNVGGGIMGQGAGIFGTVSNVFGGITKGIGSVVDTIGSIGTSVWDTVSGLFDGFFANGGNIGAGKFGVVGERGPEFVSGPATVTPMGGSNVTYNINAVDAMSFKQMIAQDPSFIHAVAMQGAKGIPGRY